MPSNLTTPNPANLPTESITTRMARGIIGQILATKKGWIIRKVLTTASTGIASLSSLLSGYLIAAEQIAAQNGVSPESLSSLDTHGQALNVALSGFLLSVIGAASEAFLSRIAAQVKEEPINVHAIPTSQD